MAFGRTRTFAKYFAGASVMALGISSTAAMAQTDIPADESAQEATTADEDIIVVTGIRASLENSMNLKRGAQGVVDAISAEDIGKFPDTNLAESIQRITGVSIDRSNGEGQYVTVRGFGPEFNLVLLNGRQMPASSLAGTSPPATRSFDFANLASEGVASIEVYKSGRATLPTGGIGSTINIRTPKPLDRPGFQGSIGVKGVLDNTFEDTKITPEISGIISKTFANDTLGILINGAYQKREGSTAAFSVGEWREGILGSNTDAWGALPPTDSGRVENRPGADDIYQVPQNAAYDFTNFQRERINGQAVLQWAPSDQFEASIDYTYSQYTLDAQTNSIGVWFNHGNTSSSWTDGPISGPNFYGESFSAGEGKDLAITGAVAANRNVNHSIGGNLKWNHPSGFRWELDAHHSTAESKPTSPFGSSVAVGSAIFGVQEQIVDFTSDMPVISVAMYPGSEIQASNIVASGNAFRTGYMKDRIQEFRLSGGYDFDDGLIDALDFGVTYTDNKVRTAYGNLQNETWGGIDVNPDPDIFERYDPADDIFTERDLSADLEGMEGSQDPAIIGSYFTIDTVRLINDLESRFGVCSNSIVGDWSGEGCIAELTTDRRLREKTIAPYIQSSHTFDILADDAHLLLGLRYEITDLVSSALTPTYSGASLLSFNEMTLFEVGRQFRTDRNSYDNWLPAVDFDMSPIEDVVLRASYSHTITRPSYGNLEAGFNLNFPARPDGGSTGGGGNPFLLPYKSKNIDLSAEWYYGPSSYISVGYFNKQVSNFIGGRNRRDTPFDLPDPSDGAIFNEAVAALGSDASFAQILNYAAANYPNAVQYDADGNPLGIIGQAGDPLLSFNLSSPVNLEDSATVDGFEFAIQHSFWDTGFGAILNYTVVNSDLEYDLLRPGFDPEPQTAINGVSDSANAVLYYENYGFQARVAYNWRDEFLAAYGTDPFFVEDYGQFDVSASYEFDNGLSIFAEGINVTNADRRGHRRADQAVYFAAPGYARYAAGLRFSW